MLTVSIRRHVGPEFFDDILLKRAICVVSIRAVCIENGMIKLVLYIDFERTVFDQILAFGYTIAYIKRTLLVKRKHSRVI